MCINIKTEKDMDNRIKALIGTLNILSDVNYFRHLAKPDGS
jgi:hypothetical protein